MAKIYYTDGINYLCHECCGKDVKELATPENISRLESVFSEKTSKTVKILFMMNDNENINLGYYLYSDLNNDNHKTSTTNLEKLLIDFNSGKYDIKGSYSAIGITYKIDSWCNAGHSIHNGVGAVDLLVINENGLREISPNYKTNPILQSLNIFSHIVQRLESEILLSDKINNISNLYDFDVEIVETLSKTIKISATSLEEAKIKAEDLYKTESILLDSSNHLDTTFNILSSSQGENHVINYIDSSSFNNTKIKQH